MCVCVVYRDNVKLFNEHGMDGLTASATCTARFLLRDIEPKNRPIMSARAPDCIQDIEWRNGIRPPRADGQGRVDGAAT